MSHPFDEDTLYGIAYGDLLDNYTTVEPQSITDQGRWRTSYSVVISNGTEYYRVMWRRGSTEMQDEGPEDIKAVRVYPHQVMTTVYKDTP